MPIGVYKRKGAEERFLAKFTKKENGCWEWTAAKAGNGYAAFTYNGKLGYGHRFSYTNYIGEIPEGKEIDHICNNPSCVNPDHLQAITHKENMNKSSATEKYKKWARKITHCPKGHEYSDENTYIHNGKRHCRICVRERGQEYEARNREKRNARKRKVKHA